MQDLPRWDFTAVYPSLESAEFEAGFQNSLQAIADLIQLFDEHGINRLESVPPNTAVLPIAETILTQFNQTLEPITTLIAYLQGHITTDSRNTLAQAKFSELQQKLAHLSMLGTRLTAWLGSLDVAALIASSPIAQAHAYTLHRAKQEATHLMSPAEESLAAELYLTGGASWTRLFGDYSSQLKVTLELEGETQTLPLTIAQNLFYDTNRAVRQHAYEAIDVTLKAATVPMAAALNSRKGEALTLSRRRGWESPLDEVLFENAIDRPTLEAMHQATREAFPDFQRYLKARARKLGLPILAWYDRMVPLGKSSQEWAYEDGQKFIVEQFATYSPKMRHLAERAFNENWIDVSPRDGKRGGAFCMWLHQGESRILTNYQPGFPEVGTLAHELGHAYHNLNLAGRTYLQRSMPMTLAETASTFCQKIVENAALKTADSQDQLIIIDGVLEYAARVVLGATADFIFEQQLFERRKQRDLSADELCEIMLAAQRETLGDAIDPEKLYPYRWVYVPHYYVANFYNFPYTFGLLFGLGLYAQYQAAPETFKAGYDDLLSMTGMGEAAELAARFGIDIRSVAFWRGSMDVLRADVDRFEKLIGE